MQANGYQHSQNGQAYKEQPPQYAHMAPRPTEGLAGIGDSLGAGVNTWLDKLKGPVFWVAVGYITCKFLDRKKVKVVD